MQRTEEVLELLLLGARFRDLRDFAAEKQWNVSDTQLRRYQQKALELCDEQMEKDRDRVFALHRTRREKLYARAMESADYGTALRILADDAQLMRLYEAPSRPAPDAAPLPDLESVLAKQLAMIEAADLPAAERARLVTMLADALTRARHADELEQRIEAIHAVLIGRKDTSK